MIPNAGPPAAIGRLYDRQAQITVGTTAGASTGVDVRHAAGLQLLIPAGAATQAVAVHCSDSIEGTYVPLNDSAGDPVSIDTAESQAYDLPEAVYTCHFLKLVAGDTAFTGVLLAKG